MSTVAHLNPTIKPQRRYSALEVRIEALRDLFRRLWKNPSARVGGFLVVATTLIGVFVPLLDNYNPLKDGDLKAKYATPDCIVGWISSQLNDTEKLSLSDMACVHPFGADKNGRDILRRVGHGMSVSLAVGIFVVVISVTVGASIGLAAGFLSGWFESVSMRMMDVILAFPSLLLAIALVTVAGASLTNGMIAIAITQIPTFARLTRSMAISIRNTEYVVAARSVGANGLSIMRDHVLPNSLAPLIVQSTLMLGTAVIETAALGFLGLGQQPPFPELGKMLAESQPALASGKWWLMVFPGVTIVLIVLGFNLMGDALRDALDPRLRGTD
ncbi:MAG TPA: ABC transporter permease [Phototrophicaceae bacterium]|nr:ABC transporter permease [Phototrophicaceae bacterium]